MIITHTFCKCINCGKKIEIFDNDISPYKDEKEKHWEVQVDCPYCGYTNEFKDVRFEMWEEEY